MCKHCERLVEDKADAPIVHEFFRVLADKANRRLREDGYVNTVTADDIEITVQMRGQPAPRSFSEAQIEVIRMLSEFDK